MKYILVTGAFGGMGRATVKALTEKGFRVFALDKKIGEPEENVIPIEADVTSEESIKRAADEVGKYTESLFAIIHFAGIYMLDSLVEISGNSFEKIIRINFFGAFYVNRTFLPFLSEGSRIIMTTSELAPLDPLPFTGIYAVSKSAGQICIFALHGTRTSRNIRFRAPCRRGEDRNARRFDFRARTVLQGNFTLQMQCRTFSENSRQRRGEKRSDGKNRSKNAENPSKEASCLCIQHKPQSAFTYARRTA